MSRGRLSDERLELILRKRVVSDWHRFAKRNKKQFDERVLNNNKQND